MSSEALHPTHTEHNLGKGFGGAARKTYKNLLLFSRGPFLDKRLRGTTWTLIDDVRIVQSRARLDFFRKKNINRETLALLDCNLSLRNLGARWERDEERRTMKKIPHEARRFGWFFEIWAHQSARCMAPRHLIKCDLLFYRRFFSSCDETDSSFLFPSQGRSMLGHGRRSSVRPMSPWLRRRRQDMPSAKESVPWASQSMRFRYT